MHTILFVEKNEKVFSAVIPYLEKELRCKIEHRQSPDEALQFIKDNYEMGRPQLVVCRNIIDDFEVGKKLLNYIYETAPDIAFISLGEIEFSGIEFQLMPERFKLADLLSAVIKGLKLSRQELEILRRPPYMGVSLSDLMILDNSLCDIYIKISKKEGEDQFVKRLHKDDKFDPETIKKYQDLGLKEVFIQSDELDMVLEAIQKKSAALLDQNHEPSELIQIGESQFELGQSLLLKLGVTELTLKIVEGQIKSVSNSIYSSAANNNIGALLKAALANKASYGYKHSFLLALLSSSVIPKMEWGRNDQLKINIEKMIYVSFLHDLYLSHEKLLKIDSRLNLVRAELSDEDKELVLYHANKISTLVQSMGRVPPGIDVILKQHHGTTNGVGFAEGPNSSLSGLAILFIVIEAFVHGLLDYKNLKLGPKALIQKLKNDFDLPSYRKVIEALNETIQGGP